MYKICHNIYDPLTTNTLFKFSDYDKTRGHRFKLTKNQPKNTPLQKFFTNRVTTAWNKLPDTTVNASSINAFKNKVDKLYKRLLYSTNWKQN